MKYQKLKRQICPFSSILSCGHTKPHRVAAGVAVWDTFDFYTGFVALEASFGVNSAIYIAAFLASGVNMIRF